MIISHDGRSVDSLIDETANHLDTILIAEAQLFVTMVATDELSPHNILNFLFQRSTFTFMVDSYPPVVLTFMCRSRQ